MSTRTCFFLLLLVLPLALVGCKDRSPPTPPSQGVSAAASADSTAGAHTHSAPGETCFICDPAKRDKGRLWCKEHGRYEDRCWICHPELRDEARPYCEEHGLYEDECFLCDPSRGPNGDATDGAGSIDPGEAPGGEGLFCNEHQVLERECGICHPDLAEGLAPGGSLLVRLASPRSAELAGLRVGRPGHGDAAATASVLGEIRYDGNRFVRVGPLAAGVVADVRVDVGDLVEAGQVVAVVHAPAAAEAKAAYIAARHAEQLAAASLARQEELRREEISSVRSLEEARADHGRASVALSLARQSLLNLGLGSGEVDALGEGASSELALRAPFAGTVVGRRAVLGEAVPMGAPLVEVADLAMMWVELSVPEELAPSISEGAALTVRVDTPGGEPVAGSVTWVAPVVDERTRLVRARAEVPNPRGLLRQGMFAQVAISLSAPNHTLRVPSAAVQRVSDQPFVFVQREPDLFAARRVQVEARLPSDELVISAGLGADDDVVLAGGFSLKSALLASRLGAGCADH